MQCEQHDAHVRLWIFRFWNVVRLIDTEGQIAMASLRDEAKRLGLE